MNSALLPETIAKTEQLCAESLPLSVPALKALARERGVDWPTLTAQARARSPNFRTAVTAEERAWIEGVLIGCELAWT